MNMRHAVVTYSSSPCQPRLTALAVQLHVALRPRTKTRREIGGIHNKIQTRLLTALSQPVDRDHDTTTIYTRNGSRPRRNPTGRQQRKGASKIGKTTQNADVARVTYVPLLFAMPEMQCVSRRNCRKLRQKSRPAKLPTVLVRSGG